VIGIGHKAERATAKIVSEESDYVHPTAGRRGGQENLDVERVAAAHCRAGEALPTVNLGGIREAYASRNLCGHNFWAGTIFKQA
jgi:hypothetical protein